VDVIDSIIWGNYSKQGSQVAVASGDPANPLLSTVTITYSDIEIAQEREPNTVVVTVEPGASGDANLVVPEIPDYFIYEELDVAEYVDENINGAHGLHGWVGDDGIDRIICNASTYDPDTWTTTGVFAYIFTVTIPDDADPDMHPDNPDSTGPIAPRTFTLERSFDMGEHGIYVSTNAFYVDVENNEIYYGVVHDEGVLKYVFDEDANNPVEDGPEGNYVFDSVVVPPPAPELNAWPNTFTYDYDHDIWYLGTADYRIFRYDGSQGPDGDWEFAFAYTPTSSTQYDHHDGLAYINGYLWLADMYGDWVVQYTPDGTWIDSFYHEPLGRDLEGLGWGALTHFWGGSFSNLISEFGGGMLQKSIGGAFPAAPAIYVEQGCTLNGWQPGDENFFSWDVNCWDPNTHNIDEDPCFVGGYYLSQPVEDWLDAALSPCVDTGSNLAGMLEMDSYTTRLDGVFDSNTVDMGYHYNEGLERHRLTVTIVEDANDPGIHGYVEPNDLVVYEGFDNVVTLTAYPDPNYRVRSWYGTDDDSSTALTNTVTMTADKIVSVEFEAIPQYDLRVLYGQHGSVTIDPNQDSYFDGTVVTITALPDPNYRVRSWSGTDDDTSTALTNTVTVDSDKIVSVRFELPRIIEVSGDPNAIADAIETAGRGDILVVAAGTYNGPLNLDGKDIIVTSTNPDDPNVVAATIIDAGGTGPGLIFDSGEGRDSIVDGLSIIGGSATSQGGGRRARVQGGGGIYVDTGCSPTVRNMIISGCSAVSDANGGGYGGGIYVNSDSSPYFVNCTVTDCNADRGGGAYCDIDSSAVFNHCTLNFNSAIIGGGIYYHDVDLMSQVSDCNISDNTAQYGAGMYVDPNSPATIVDTMLLRNDASQDGGGIYLTEVNDVSVVNCHIERNTATRGAGLYCFDSTDLTISGCFIRLTPLRWASTRTTRTPPIQP